MTWKKWNNSERRKEEMTWEEWNNSRRRSGGRMKGGRRKGVGEGRTIGGK